MNKKLTINDIAKLSNVSKATVSFYLNGKYEKMSENTKNKIGEVIKSSGYKPSAVARTLSIKESRIIGVIIGDICKGYANQFVKGIMDYANKEGYQIILASSEYDIKKEIKHVNNMKSMNVDGFIVQPTIHFNYWLEKNNHNLPVVFFDSPTIYNNNMWVKTNNYEAVYEACEELVKKNYEQYILISADPKVLVTRLERTLGFTNCLDIHGKSYDTFILDEYSSVDMIKEKIDQYLLENKKTCIFICNNWLLSKMYKVIKMYKEHIPSKLGVIGFDSLEWTELISPKITTIVQPAYDEGVKAASILIDSLENRNKESKQQVLDCSVNWGEST
ncbi:MAG: LacI family DNA-binding transcriptional regulator [Anaerorhabdus sp.]